MRIKCVVLMALLTLTGAQSAHAQILVAPIQLFLRDRAPLGTFYLYNQSAQAQEITVSFRFGYPVGSDSGGIAMVYGDTLPLKDRSMQTWVRAFPKQFVLGPGQRQEVRISARPPRDLPDGAYFTRLVTASMPQAPKVDSLAPGVSARIVFRLEQVTTVVFSHGQTASALTADSLLVRMDAARVSFLTPLAPGGNAPFFGSSTITVFSATGAEAASSKLNFSMYVPMVQRFDFPRSTLPRGTYTAELRVLSERDDIAAHDQLRTEPIVRRTTFAIP